MKKAVTAQRLFGIKCVDLHLNNSTKAHRHIPVGFGNEEEYEKAYCFLSRKSRDNLWQVQ